MPLLFPDDYSENCCYEKTRSDLTLENGVHPPKAQAGTKNHDRIRRTPRKGRSLSAIVLFSVFLPSAQAWSYLTRSWFEASSIDPGEWHPFEQRKLDLSPFWEEEDLADHSVDDTAVDASTTAAADDTVFGTPKKKISWLWESSCPPRHQEEILSNGDLHTAAQRQWAATAGAAGTGDADWSPRHHSNWHVPHVYAHLDGWKCEGLIEKPEMKAGHDCELQCVMDISCLVWQWDRLTQTCFHGGPQLAPGDAFRKREV